MSNNELRQFWEEMQVHDPLDPFLRPNKDWILALFNEMKKRELLGPYPIE